MARKSTVMIVSEGEFNPAPGKDLKNPAMTLENNPMARDIGSPMEDMIVNRNMDRLIDDSHKRRCPIHGHVYRGIMDNRYGG